MTSVFAARMSTIGSPVGFRFNGELVVREIAGVNVDCEEHAAMVVAETVDEDARNGKDFVHHYMMHVADSQEVTDRDTYTIREERCRVVKVGKPQNGMKPVWLQRVEGVRTEAYRTSVR